MTSSEATRESSLRFDVEHAQSVLNELNLSGWLFYDFQGQNPIARQALGIAPDAHLTRRWFYWLPVAGEPALVVHRIESSQFGPLPGERHRYSGQGELQRCLHELLEGAFAVAMEYYPRASIPYLSRVDAGTVEWVRTLGVDVVSSHTLATRLLSTWNDDQYATHREAVEMLCEVRSETTAWLHRELAAGETVTEYQVQAHILEAFAARGFETDHPPIVAVGAHAGDPHYAPSATQSAEIAVDKVLLIDMWARRCVPHGVYGDLTFMFWVGAGEVPERINDAFEAVLAGRDAALDLVTRRWEDDAPVCGWELDRAARRAIYRAGFGDAFVHRTGHNLGATSPHGDGPHLDDLETHDERELVPRLGFTIEPGVYLPEEDFGIRSEINVFIDPEQGPIVHGDVQREWWRIDPTQPPDEQPAATTDDVEPEEASAHGDVVDA